LAIFLIQNYVIKPIFYSGRVDNQGIKTFNLSLFAEIFLTIFYVSLAACNIYFLATNLPIWYEWIWPILFFMYFLLQGVTIFRRRNNFIKVRNNIFQYNLSSEGENVAGEVQLTSFSFYKNDSDGIRLTRHQKWFLQIKGFKEEKMITLIFDLYDLNLDGYKKALEKTLIQNGVEMEK
jgi:hypothetical protein